MIRELLRCEVTGNPCGTDTWMEGSSCPCDSCQKYLIRLGLAQDPEFVPLKAVLFDLDGTLVEAREIHRLSLNDALAEHGYTITLAEHTAKYNGLPTRVKLEILSKEKGLPEHLHDWIARRKQIYTRRRIEREITLDEQKVALFKSLKDRGVRIAVCSNAVTQTVALLLEKIGVLKYVDLYLSNEDVKNPKPHPEIFLTAAERLGFDIKDCAIVEDSPVGIEAAKAAGAALVVEVDNPQDVTEVMF